MKCVGCFFCQFGMLSKNVMIVVSVDCGVELLKNGNTFFF